MPLYGAFVLFDDRSDVLLSSRTTKLRGGVRKSGELSQEVVEIFERKYHTT